MALVCPTITAYSELDYNKQLEKVQEFASRIQVDLTDGLFTKEKTVTPSFAHWSPKIRADIHLMFSNPLPAIETLINKKPNLIIIHAECKDDLNQVAHLCHNNKIKAGIALLQDTNPEGLGKSIELFDYALIFSGNLGYQGSSQADLKLLDKVKLIKQIKNQIEIGWDGGVNNQNISELVYGGVDVINVGGFIQKADDPYKTYLGLQRIADETGTT